MLYANFNEANTTTIGGELSTWDDSEEAGTVSHCKGHLRGTALNGPHPICEWSDSSTVVGSYVAMTSSDGPVEEYNRPCGNLDSHEKVPEVTKTPAYELEPIRDAAIRANWKNHLHSEESKVHSHITGACNRCTPITPLAGCVVNYLEP